MDKGTVQVFCGEGTGKTTAAIGKGISAVGEHKRVIMIQFLKGCQETEDIDVLKRLEPDMKIFRFEKLPSFFVNLTEEEKKEELMNIRNGLNFAKKVLATGECNLLILDEILGLIDMGIITGDDMIKLIEIKGDSVDLIVTGVVFPEMLFPYVDKISKIDNVKS